MGNDNNCQTFCDNLTTENPRERFRHHKVEPNPPYFPK